MPIKLFVDDLRPCPEGWTLARTITEAIRILATQYVTEVSLDHDIMHSVKPLELIPLPAGTPVEDPERFMRYAENGITVPVACPETFEPVAYYLATYPPGKRPKVVFHTANPSGQVRMKRIIDGFGS